MFDRRLEYVIIPRLKVLTIFGLKLTEMKPKSTWFYSKIENLIFNDSGLTFSKISSKMQSLLLDARVFCLHFSFGFVLCVCVFFFLFLIIARSEFEPKTIYHVPRFQFQNYFLLRWEGTTPQTSCKSAVCADTTNNPYRRWMYNPVEFWCTLVLM